MTFFGVSCVPGYDIIAINMYPTLIPFKEAGEYCILYILYIIERCIMGRIKCWFIVTSG